MRAILLAAGRGSRLQQDEELLKVPAAAMERGGDVLLMDADVLYDSRIAQALLVGGDPVNRVLIDRDFEAGDEPVKVCIQGGVPIELIDFPLHVARAEREILPQLEALP